MNLLSMTALELGSCIKSGKTSCREAVEETLAAIEKTDSKIHAYITVDKEQVLKNADAVQKKIEKGFFKSPLAGVPVIIKDNICTKDLRTTCASKMLENFVPCYDATVVEKLKNAGALIIGKGNMDEFAMGSTCETSYFGPSKNPFDINRVTGGSSGGPAAAVASKEAFLGVGSDTGGSIRQPSAFCNVTGFKPTYGSVSRYGLIAYASSMDQIGPICKDAKDCAAVTDIISGKDRKDSTSLDIKTQYLNNLTGSVKGLRIGIPKEYFSNKYLNSEIAEIVLNSAHVLERQGAVLKEINLPFYDYVVPAYYIIACAEASSNLARFDGVKYGYSSKSCHNIDELYKLSRSQGFGTEVKKRILLGSFVLSSGYYDAYYLKALKIKSLIEKDFKNVFNSTDILLCPVSPVSPPFLGESLNDSLKMYISDIFTVSANLAGLPGISFPSGFDRNNMPIGTQILGAPLQDLNVLNTALSFQNVTEYHKIISEVI